VVVARRITVTVESSLGEDGPLTVEDGLGQILDFFDLMTVAGDHFTQGVGWSLVSVTKNSPLMATAEAFSTHPGVLTIHQFSRHSQSFGSGRARSISLTAVRSPRVNQESLLLASFLG